MNPLITIQILNWNRAEETQRAIRSAQNQSYNPIEIVVVDNGSTDDSVALTRANFPKIKIVELERNYGCPGGRNRGIPHCKGEYIFYLDNDGVLHEEAVSIAYDTIVSSDNIGIVTGIVYDFDDPAEIDTKCKIGHRIPYSVKEFQGGICLHDKKIYDVAGFYPDHFMYGAEESYLSLKLMETPYKIIKNENVILWHKRSNSARNRKKEIIHAFFNKLYLALVLYPIRHAVIFLGYFLVYYPIHAFRQGVLPYYLLSFPKLFISTLSRAMKNRNPVGKEAFNKYNN